MIGGREESVLTEKERAREERARAKRETKWWVDSFKEPCNHICQCGYLASDTL